jgi:hypothetical protein
MDWVAQRIAFLRFRFALQVRKTAAANKGSPRLQQGTTQLKLQPPERRPARRTSESRTAGGVSTRFECRGLGQNTYYDLSGLWPHVSMGM